MNFPLEFTKGLLRRTLILFVMVFLELRSL